MTTPPQPDTIRVTLQVVQCLDNLDIPYLIGGSLACAVHGLARATMDADLVADIRPEQVKPLILSLQNDFYIDDEMIFQALAHSGSFNLIHLETLFKVDVFVMKQRPFDHQQLARRTAQLLDVTSGREAYVATAEDTLLAKLEWYRLGGEVSERQWRDVLGVIAVQGERLEMDYLRHWASELGVSDLLERALEE
ncbi:MAG: hypothetical protein ACWGO1_14505, partial [Anaerolineales bacterium]